jgi:hypothetical protein
MGLPNRNDYEWKNADIMDRGKTGDLCLLVLRRSSTKAAAT